MPRLSAKGKQLSEAGRDVGGSLMKRAGPIGFLRSTSTDSKKVTFVILKNYANASVRKKSWSPFNKARREASRNTFVEENGMPGNSQKSSISR